MQPTQTPAHPKAKHSFTYWQTSTIIGLFVGYSGYYICRTNLAVATPLIITEFSGQGMNKEVMGQIASLGVVFYALGKVVNGILGDFIGGKKVFIIGMVGSVVATIAFGLGTGLAIFFAAWAINRLVQSMGWGGLVKTTANWVAYQAYGRMMALLSLSFLFGDIVAKLLLGQLIKMDIGWRELFFVAAALLTGIACVSFFLVKNRPESVGYQSPAVNPDNLFTTDEHTEKPQSMKELLLPYFKSLPFLLMLVMSFGLTAIREAFNFWIPTYLFESTGFSEGEASQFSAAFPVFGMVSILGAGYLSDTLLKGKRGILIGVACIPIAGVLCLMGLGLKDEVIPLILISLVGLLVLGPYSFLAGAMSLDMGGRKGAATASGLMDAVGYVGGTLAVWLTGRLAERSGWNSAFIVLAAIAAFTAVAAFVYYLTQEKKKNM
ncbi:MFS transporter [Rhodocytophaga aerolata]|uniref:MFS transporter n=1 Tax=Rhodocytophaga aerolata TaxID=455078 RepID=A0ABT8R4U8_9BACT|nr:MFS transporter [Rhodocytophaga aerolata]MDO1447122.1 MFS transporter [Rhodocytophaga aerolata]